MSLEISNDRLADLKKLHADIIGVVDGIRIRLTSLDAIDETDEETLHGAITHACRAQAEIVTLVNREEARNKALRKKWKVP